LTPASAKRAIKNGSVCRKCHCTRIAPLGWKATKARYGADVAVAIQQRYRLEHPSDLERIVRQALDDLGIAYERERWIVDGSRNWLVDFALPEGKLIEVNGTFSHSHHGERDQPKLASLTGMGFAVLVLTESEIHNGLGDHLAAFAEGTPCPS